MCELIVFRTIIITRSDNNNLLETLNIDNFSPQSVNLTKLVTKKMTVLPCRVFGLPALTMIIVCL